jgi:hypothetical protein
VDFYSRISLTRCWAKLRRQRICRIKAANLRSGTKRIRNFYGDVTGYQEATKEGKPKKHDGSVVPGANVSVRFRRRNNDPGDGQEADLKPIA